jgi:hypothetical protein
MGDILLKYFLANEQPGKQKSNEFLDLTFLQ